MDTSRAETGSSATISRGSATWRRPPQEPARCWAFLDAQAKDTASYDTNPLWKVVDGPWQLRSYRPDGYAALVPNPRYDIRPKPTIGKFVMQPFSSDAAEADDLATGALTYGYVPVSDLNASTRFTAQGDELDPWPLLSNVGTMAWCAALLDDDHDVDRVTANVVDRFIDPAGFGPPPAAER